MKMQNNIIPKIMSKQTAVELLIDEIRNCIKQNGKLDAISISKLKMEAKAMEKQQIFDAYDEGYTDAGYADHRANHYYNETFK